MELRTCKKCNIEKEITEYYYQRGWVCKKCANKSTTRKLKLRKKRQKVKYSLAWLKPKKDKMIKRCKENGREFNISNEELITMYKDCCHYCGKHKANMTIDRKDSDIGYITGNCVPACWYCNRRKGTTPYDEFVS